MSSDRLTIILQEYSALRSQQSRRFDSIDRMTNYILLMILGILGATATLSKQTISESIVSAVIASLPIFFSPLVFDYLHNELVIYRIGRYFQRVLIKEIQREVGGQLLQWDEFNNQESLHPLSLATTAFRNLILVLPVSIPTPFTLFVFPARSRLVNVLLGIDGIIFVAVLVVMIYKAIYFIHVVNGRVEQS